MAALSYQKSTIRGGVVALVAASVGGDAVAPNTRGALLVTNGSGSSINVTVAVPGNTRYGQAQPDVVIAVPANSSKVIGPFDQDLADPSDGLVHITYSSVTTVTVAAIQI